MPPSDSVVCVFGQNDDVMLYYASNIIFSRAVSHKQVTVVSFNLSDVTMTWPTALIVARTRIK